MIVIDDNRNPICSSNIGYQFSNILGFQKGLGLGFARIRQAFYCSHLRPEPSVESWSVGEESCKMGVEVSFCSSGSNGTFCILTD